MNKVFIYSLASLVLVFFASITFIATDSFFLTLAASHSVALGSQLIFMLLFENKTR